MTYINVRVWYLFIHLSIHLFLVESKPFIQGQENGIMYLSDWKKIFISNVREGREA